MSKEKQEYTESRTLSDFGYFRLGNAERLRSFEELRQTVHPDTSILLEISRKVVTMSAADIPLKLELPARPTNEVRLEEINISLAEIAGGTAAIKLLTGRDSLILGHTYLGRQAKRWFNTIPLKKQPPPSERDNWIVDARGKRTLKKLDKKMSLVYRTTEDLFEDFDISVSKQESSFEVRFGKVQINIGEDTKIVSSGKLDRKDLHALIGFCKIFFLYSASKYSQTPSFNFVNKPLEPFSGISGVQSIEKTIEIDQIKSYI